MNKRLNKCLDNQEHDMRISPDQRDTGRMGVRYECRHCHRMLVEYEPSLHYRLSGIAR